MNAVMEATDRTRWLGWRKSGLGASDMPAILGVSPFRTPLDVYLEKIGEAPEEPPTLDQRVGLALEPVVLDLYAAETGRRIAGTQVQQHHATLPFLRATLDAVCEPEPGETDGRIVEAKTTSPRADVRDWGAAGSDELPDHVIVQAQHQMLVRGERAEVVDVPCLLRRCEYRRFTVERDAELCRMILDAGREFWARVVERRPPAPSLPADARHLPRVFGQGEGECELDADAVDLVSHYEEAAHAAALGRLADDTRRRMSAEIVALLGEHASGRLPDGRVVRRKLVTVPERVQTVKESRYYRLSIK